MKESRKPQVAAMMAIALTLIVVTALTPATIPIASATSTYDCDAARRVCYDIYNGTASLCTVITGDPIKCNQDWLNNVSRCVSQSTDGQCSYDALRDKTGSKV